MFQGQHGHVLEDAGGQAGKDGIGHGTGLEKMMCKSGLRLFARPRHGRKAAPAALKNCILNVQFARLIG
jgi:hypothetical protein